VGAQFLAESADGMVTVALPLYVLATTNSPLAMSLTAMAQMLGGAVAGVVGGVLADRFDRQRVLRLSFAARALLLIAAWLAGPVGLVVALGVSARVLGQLDNPSFDALIPGQARDDLQQVLSLRRFIQNVSIIVGPAIGAIAVWLAGEQATLGIAALLFVGAIAIHLRLHGLDTDLADRRAAHHDSNWVDLARGLSIVATTPYVRRIVVWWTASVAMVALAMASAAVWYDETLQAGDYWYGLAVSAYGIGAAVGTLIAGGHTFRWPLPRILLVATPCYAFTAVLGVLAETPWLIPLGWLLWGIAFGPEVVRSETEFVERVAAESRGRAYAGVGVALMLGLASGYAIAGPLLEQFGPRTTTFLTALGILAVATIWIGPARRPPAAPDSFTLEAESGDRRELEPL
jgi:MFS family permease